MSTGTHRAQDLRHEETRILTYRAYTNTTNL